MIINTFLFNFVVSCGNIRLSQNRRQEIIDLGLFAYEY